MLTKLQPSSMRVPFLLRSVLLSFVCGTLIVPVQAQGVLEKYLKPGATIAADVVTVQPPQEINEYLKKVDAAAKADPAWFSAHAKGATPGVPLPYDPKLGLTEKEYKEYIALWDARDFQSLEKVVVKLEEQGDLWQIQVSGPGMPIRLLRYDAKADNWISSNGTLKRIEDIKADPKSILGAWSGQEWKMEKEDPLVRAKENIAIGKDDEGFGLLIYRYQEATPEGRRSFDRSLVVRFKL